MQFVAISVCSALGSSRFQCAALAVRLDFGAQRSRFVAISVRSAFGSSRFQRTARVVRRFLRVGRTSRFDLARSGFVSGEHASVVSAPARVRWVSFTRTVVARK